MADPYAIAAHFDVPFDTMIAYAAALDSLLQELLLDADAPGLEVVGNTFVVVAAPASRMAQLLARDGTYRVRRVGPVEIGHQLALYAHQPVAEGFAAWLVLASRFDALAPLLGGVACHADAGRVRVTLAPEPDEEPMNWSTATRAPR